MRAQLKIINMKKNTSLPKGMKLRPIALLLGGLLLTSYTHAQVSINTSGGEATGSGGSVTYSVGQVVYTTNNGNNGSEAHGVQHAYEIYTVGVNETEFNISLTAFPNPTSSNITLQISEYTNEKFSYQIFDIQGKQLSNGQIVAQQTQINMNNFPASTYTVDIFNHENNKIQSFKVMKN